MKVCLLICMLLLQLPVSAKIRVFWITPSGVSLSGTGLIYLGDTLAWANMTGHYYNVSGSKNPFHDYPFSCDSTAPCYYQPPSAGYYKFFCSSPDNTSFNGTFTVVDPTNVVESIADHTLFTCIPNPVKKQLQVNGAGTYVITLYDLLGNNVARCNITNTGTIDVSALPDGNYLLSAINGDKQTTQRIIINK